MEEEKIDVKFVATVTGQKGTCHAKHKLGQKFELNCYESGGLCGYFYHDVFPNLNVMQFGGKYPWWDPLPHKRMLPEGIVNVTG